MNDAERVARFRALLLEHLEEGGGAAAKSSFEIAGGVGGAPGRKLSRREAACFLSGYVAGVNASHVLFDWMTSGADELDELRAHELVEAFWSDAREILLPGDDA